MKSNKLIQVTANIAISFYKDLQEKHIDPSICISNAIQILNDNVKHNLITKEEKDAIIEHLELGLIF